VLLARIRSDLVVGRDRSPPESGARLPGVFACSWIRPLRTPYPDLGEPSASVFASGAGSPALCRYLSDPDLPKLGGSAVAWPSSPLEKRPKTPRRKPGASAESGLTEMVGSESLPVAV
jgi:hypothetical protein